jgi:dihydroxy-acid dehydratase
MELNKYSKTITQDETQPAAQAMLYGIGLTEERLKQSIGIVRLQLQPMHLNGFANKKGSGKKI